MSSNEKSTQSNVEKEVDVQKMLQEALEAYKAEEAKRVAEAVASALEAQKAENEEKISLAVASALEAQKIAQQGTLNTGKKATVKKSPMEELVEIEIAITNKEESDVVVSVNGRTFQIKRGEKVQVPRYVKEVLDNTMKMDKLRIQRIREATRNFA